MLKKSAIILALAFILGGIQAASAQTTKTIKFAKGKNSATVKGMTGTTGVYYNLRANGGQKVMITLAPKTGVGVKVEKGADEVLLREEKGGTYEVYLEEGGEISIFLGSTNGKSKAYTLTVKITNMTDV